ncbi:MAG: hypothetical protein AABY22_14495 [Nanoarchaeota archaeon]
MKDQQKLASVKLQTVIDLKTLNIDLLCPVLSFGRKKSDKFQFPIIFKNYNQAEKLYDELEKLKGKSFDVVRTEGDTLYKKYKKYHYKGK